MYICIVIVNLAQRQASRRKEKEKGEDLHFNPIVSRRITNSSWPQRQQLSRLAHVNL